MKTTLHNIYIYISPTIYIYIERDCCCDLISTRNQKHSDLNKANVQNMLKKIPRESSRKATRKTIKQRDVAMLTVRIYQKSVFACHVFPMKRSLVMKIMQVKERPQTSDQVCSRYPHDKSRNIVLKINSWSCHDAKYS